MKDHHFLMNYQLFFAYVLIVIFLFLNLQTMLPSGASNHMSQPENIASLGQVPLADMECGQSSPLDESVKGCLYTDGITHSNDHRNFTEHFQKGVQIAQNIKPLNATGHVDQKLQFLLKLNLPFEGIWKDQH